MFEERTDMTHDPSEPDLEALLAADEAAISDDGFSNRVVAELAGPSNIRRATIYGAGLMGFGFAVGSLPALVKALPPLKIAVDGAAKASGHLPDLTRLPDLTSLASWSADSQATFLVLGAAGAMILTSVLLVLRER
jgi:predicted naringenin-chalcone synthase